VILEPGLDESKPRLLHGLLRQRLLALGRIEGQRQDVHQLVAQPCADVGIQRGAFGGQHRAEFDGDAAKAAPRAHGRRDRNPVLCEAGGKGLSRQFHVLGPDLAEALKVVGLRCAEERADPGIGRERGTRLKDVEISVLDELYVVAVLVEAR